MSGILAGMGLGCLIISMVLFFTNGLLDAVYFGGLSVALSFAALVFDCIFDGGSDDS